MRVTSLKAYREIKRNGLLSRNRFKAYRILFKYGPLTCNEVGKKAKQIYEEKTHRHQYHARCRELSLLGVISEVGRRVCSVSGHEALTYDVTDKLPLSAVPRTRPTASMLKGAAKELRSALKGVLVSSETREVVEWLKRGGGT